MRRISSVVERLECPRCAIRVDGFSPEVFRGIQECYKRRCQQHWWAMRLHAGDVEMQLAVVFGDELARDLMHTWSLPATLDGPMYWQLSLSRNQSAQIQATGSRKYLRLVMTLLHLRETALVAAGTQV
jgi:hypothetical protein